jgi:cysteine desulfurase
MDSIYLDNNATTPLLPAVWEAMRAAADRFGNAASAHHVGRRARQALEDARERCAALLGAHPDELIFTSGATEANNLAIFGLAGDPPGHIVVSPIEHPSVTEPIQRLAKLGFLVESLPVDSTGVVSPSCLGEHIRSDTHLVCVMLANHETGAVEPIRELAGANGGRARFHCDAVQAAGKKVLDFHDLGVTSLSISAHKFHGPQGIGALLLRRGTKLIPLVWGGHQQHGFRPGTEPIALAIGMAAALDVAVRDAAAHECHVRRLRAQFLERLRADAAPMALNGPAEGGMPHTLNLSFPGCQADSLLMNLDLAGVACSTGSACSSGSLLPSPVLKAMGVSDVVLRSAMRFSLSALLSEAEVAEAARRIAAVVKRLRQIEETTG